MSRSSAPQQGGIGLLGALFLVFVTLRLTDNIDWAWYWVASPLWIPFAAFAVVFVAILSCWGVAWVVRKVFGAEDANAPFRPGI